MTADISQASVMRHRPKARPSTADQPERAAPARGDGAGLLLTVEDVARITGRPPDLVRRWARQGLLIALRDTDGDYRFPVASLAALARDRTDTQPLYRQLRQARLRRGLSQAEVARLLGTSQRMIAFWERGPEPDERGRVRGKPIGARYVPAVRQWVDEGRAPNFPASVPARADC